MILGTGAYKAGFNAVLFRHELDAGLGWLRGFADPAAVRTYYLNLRAAERIARRARAIRQANGVLSGYAIEEDDTVDTRSFAGDVVSVFEPGEKQLWTATIAARLKGRMADVYPDITAAAVASQLRELDVEIKNVREPRKDPNQGCELAAVEAVAPRRELAGV
jgi:S-DNA-T family DNA segregation ATPase FtsK/SpoIIIE